MSLKNINVTSRQDVFKSKSATKIWYERPHKENPYIAETALCYGYDLRELIERKSFVDVFFLLFKGEFPEKHESILLEKLMIAFINPGPRHPATRASMSAAISKTDVAHLLPIALSVMGGAHLGATEVFNSMWFLKKNIDSDPVALAEQLVAGIDVTVEEDWRVAPGFGTRFGGIDSQQTDIASSLTDVHENFKTLLWAEQFANQLQQHGAGWLSPGLAAAVFNDLGMHPKAGIGLYQIFSAPGLFAHGLEQANKPITNMPFLDKDHYVILD